MTIRTQPMRKTLTANGLTLHYLEWGEAEAPDIVCVHGYTGSADAFNALARQLEDRYRILALDVRGHGESAWSPTGAYSYADQAGDLAEFAKQLRLDKFVLIGTSMGGIIAMAYAAEHAERLLGLVINDIGPDVEVGSQRITGLVGSRPDEFGTLEEAMAYRRSVSPIVAGRSAEDQRELALGVLRRRPDGRWGWKMDPAGQARCPGAAALVAGIAGFALSDDGGVGGGERRPLRDAGAAHGGRAAARRAGDGPGHRPRTDIGRAGGAGGPRPLPRRLARPIALSRGADRQRHLCVKIEAHLGAQDRYLRPAGTMAAFSAANSAAGDAKP